MEQGSIGQRGADLSRYVFAKILADIMRGAGIICWHKIEFGKSQFPFSPKVSLSYYASLLMYEHVIVRVPRLVTFGNYHVTYLSAGHPAQAL